MSRNEDNPSPATTPIPRIPIGSYSSGYFSPPRPTSPSPNTRRTGTEPGQPRFSRSTTGGRSNSVSSSRGISGRANAPEDVEYGQGGGAFSEVDEDAAVEREELDEDQDEDPPSPSPEELDALKSSRQFTEDDPLTVKDRQSLLNAEHPFGLPLWKPALYKKSRTVTRNAENALHSVPGASVERHLSLGNVLWTLLFGWWLALVCIVLSVPIWLVESFGNVHRHASIVFSLGWYIFFPFGKYVEGDLDVLGSPDDCDSHDELIETDENDDESTPTQSPAGHPMRREDSYQSTSTIRKAPSGLHPQGSTPSWNGDVAHERTSLGPSLRKSQVYYGTLPTRSFSAARSISSSTTSGLGFWLGKITFWLFLITLIAPLMLLASILCWALVFIIPMAKLNWELLVHLFQHPLALRFRSAPPPMVVPQQPSGDGEAGRDPGFTIKRTRLSAGNPAPSGRPRRTVLLCTYKAFGSQYYKYTVGGVNILFVNTLPVVFLVILDGFLLLPWVENQMELGHYVHPVLKALANRAVLFACSLTSVIPLSYFIGMAVASISAQSSIGMGAVINATFGSIVEIILYAISLTRSKGQLVEGSIVGSILAGVLLMPGLSMMCSALKKKESKFNAKSAGVTSTMLVMAMIGTLAPTMFYQTYGNFELVCDGCPTSYPPMNNTGFREPYADGSALTVQGHHVESPWACKHCYYEHVNPELDPFYQHTVKPFMYYCAAILLLSYLIGLWFSLRTHASQIWQNPQKLLHPIEVSAPTPGPTRRSIYQRLVSGNIIPLGHPHQNNGLPTHNPSIHQPEGNGKKRLNRQSSMASTGSIASGVSDSGVRTPTPHRPTKTPSLSRRTSQSPAHNAQQNQYVPSLYTPIVESLDQAIRGPDGSNFLHLPQPITTEDFARAVTVATVSALRHQGETGISPARPRGGLSHHEHDASGGEEHGHGGPSWSRTTSASVLLSCTILYAAIAEILVDVVDVVLEDSAVQEKFLGITLFALVPNTTEFMNAMSFALNGNISLSMEIGSAYALQVCLLQIPAMVAFSAWWDPMRMGLEADTFTLIFPRWDIIAIILAIFLLTYTYIEAKSNYHRGSILILSYLVLTAGFYFAPAKDNQLDLLRFSSPPETSSYGDIAKSVLTSLWTQ